MSESPTGPILEVRDLRLVHPGAATPAVSVPALDVARGETLAVIGPNGAGKSSLFAALACLRPWNGGTLCFDGRLVADPGPAALAYRRQLAVVMQDPLLLDATALDNAAQALRYRGVGRSTARAKAGSWLERLGVSRLADRRARHLSGGEAQRVSLARAMVIEPRLVLLDEPFAPLDAPSRAAFIGDLRRVLEETGTTALLVTHDRSEALMLADRIAVMLRGRIAQIGAPTEVFERPADVDVAAFVGVETIEPAVIAAGTDDVVVAAVGERRTPVTVAGRGGLAPGTPVLFCIRPEDVFLELPSAGGEAHRRPTSVRNHLSGVVREVVPLEGQFRVTVDCGFDLVALVTKASAVELGLRKGLAVEAAFKAHAARLLARGPAAGREERDVSPARAAAVGDRADRTPLPASREVT